LYEMSFFSTVEVFSFFFLVFLAVIQSDFNHVDVHSIQITLLLSIFLGSVFLSKLWYISPSFHSSLVQTIVNSYCCFYHLYKTVGLLCYTYYFVLDIFFQNVVESIYKCFIVLFQM
jgi:hypothetical protein